MLTGQTRKKKQEKKPTNGSVYRVAAQLKIKPKFWDKSYKKILAYLGVGFEILCYTIWAVFSGVSKKLRVQFCFVWMTFICLDLVLVKFGLVAFGF